MGALTSRQNAGVEEVDIPSNSVYRYPPKTGSYFASHFIMGGEKFESTHPEGYLFGENTDLNFLGNRPVVFPYNAPPPHEPVKTLRSLINIRKDTLRLVRCNEDMKLPGQEAGKSHSCYNIEFTFDADTQVAITIYYQAIEEFHNGVPIYLPQDSSLQSETVHFKRGVCQQFCLPSHYVNLSEWADEELLFDMDKEVFPMVVQAVVDEGDDHLGHSHVLLATFEKHMDESYCVKPLKQKQVVDGVSYLLQEIYGIENKYNSQESKMCGTHLSYPADTCACATPAQTRCVTRPTVAPSVDYRSAALLQIRAMRKKLNPLTPTGFNPVITSHTSDSEEHSASEHIPPGYEAVSLLEALNGPLNPSPSAPPLQGLTRGHVSGSVPTYGSDSHHTPARSLSPLEHSVNSSQNVKHKKSSTKSLSQSSSVLPEEEDEKSCSESEVQTCRRKLHVEQQESGVTPESDNLTLSSSGAIDQSSCNGTPFSSTITSPEDPVSSSLAQSVMSMASSHSQHSQISTDTLSSMSGSYMAGAEGEEVPETPVDSRAPSHHEGEEIPNLDAKGHNFVAAIEEQDSEGNDVTEEDCGSPTKEQGGRRRSEVPCPEFDNNNQGQSDTHIMTGLDNEQPPDGRFAGSRMNKGKVENLRDKIDGNEVDLSLSNLTEVPVKELSLKWLDLKDNPLEATLAKAAGDCLDEKQCKQCASMVLQHMKVLQEEADIERERRLSKEREQEKKKEAKQRDREAREKEAQKKKKADEKEKKRQEYQAQMSALAAQEQQKKKREEKKKKAAQNDGKKTNSESVSKGKRSICSLFFSFLLKLLLLLIVGVSSVLAVCQLTELRKEAYCVPVNAHFEETLRWAQTLDIVQQVNQIMSDLRVWD
ncbi:E3 ubiquitin ligase RNF157 [Triplophysa tibetana]|uniref:E3 ubiquitin-protein ligase n=1 Tax=Triplophysa tibetana TaxID=1572043 RepID=A0A5A9PW79_9TELE|nr:E3 ubiquitin ligase RNF157 [Triplophysa tibetana]